MPACAFLFYHDFPQVKSPKAIPSLRSAFGDFAGTLS